MQKRPKFRGIASRIVMLLVLLALSCSVGLAEWCGALCAPSAASHACCEHAGHSLDLARHLDRPVCGHSGQPPVAIAENVLVSREHGLALLSISVAAGRFEVPASRGVLAVTGAFSALGTHPVSPPLPLRI